MKAARLPRFNSALLFSNQTVAQMKCSSFSAHPELKLSPWPVQYHEVAGRAILSIKRAVRYKKVWKRAPSCADALQIQSCHACMSHCLLAGLPSFASGLDHPRCAY